MLAAVKLYVWKFVILSSRSTYKRTVIKTIFDTMSSGKDKDYKCGLSESALKRAREELNEIPDNRLLEVKELRKRIEKVPGLVPCTDTKFLLAFLRGCCFDQEKSFELLKNFYQVKVDRPDVFDDLKPSRIKHVLESKVFELLRKRDKEGRRVIIFRSKYWNPEDFAFMDMMKVYAIFVSKLIQEEETQVHGVVLWNECSSLTMKQFASTNPMDSKFIVHLAFYHFPLHVRRNDFINENTLFDMFFALFSPFIDAELHKKIKFLGKKTENLHEEMDPEDIPSDLGGKAEPFTYTEWNEELLASDKWFEEQNKFGFLSMKLEDKKKDKSNENAGMQGLGGSFKKLEM